MLQDKFKAHSQTHKLSRYSFWHKRTRAQKLALLIIAVTFLWIFSGVFLGHHTAKNAVVETPKKRVSIETTHVVPHGPRLNVTGRTEAEKRVDIIAQTAGQVAEIPFAKGSVVKKGDVILRLSSEGRGAAVEEARASLAQQTANLNGQKLLFAQGVIARKAIDDSQTKYAVAKTAFEKAVAEQDRAVITAPFAGLLNDVPDVSKSIRQGDKIAAMLVLDPLKIIGEVSERAVSRLRAGQDVLVQTPDGVELKGTLTYVSRSAQTATRTFRVEAQIHNPEFRIPEGASVTMVVTLASAPATKIRRSALTLNEKGVIGVRTIDEAGSVKFQPVTIIDDMPDEFWVSGLQDGAKMITVGQDFVIDGEIVQGVESASQ